MLTGNQIKHPVDVRYQRLNVQNVHSHRLLALPSATAVLHALGFCAPESTDSVHASKMGEVSGTSGHFWLWKGGSLPTASELAIIRAQRSLLLQRRGALKG